MTEQDAARLRVVLDHLFDLQTDVEARPLPRNVNHLFAIDFIRQFLLIDRSGDSDHCIRMKMIDVLVRNQRVQRRIDRARARIQIKDAVAVHRVHHIFNRRLRAAIWIAQIKRLHRADFVEIERRKAIAFRCAQVSA